MSKERFLRREDKTIHMKQERDILRIEREKCVERWRKIRY